MFFFPFESQISNEVELFSRPEINVNFNLRLNSDVFLFCLNPPEKSGDGRGATNFVIQETRPKQGSFRNEGNKS